MHKRTFTRAAGVLFLFASFAVVPGQLADAATTVKNPRAEQERVRREKAAAAEQVNTLKASAKELQDALATIDENLRQEEAALEAAQQTVDAETAAAEALRAQEQAATDRVAALDKLVIENAIDAYMSPTSTGDLFSMSSNNINEAVRKQALYDLTNTKTRDAADQIKAARADLERLEAQRNAVLVRAQAAKADVATRITVVDSARAEQQKFVEAADDRVDHALSELGTLESLDKQLAAQIEAEARALALAAEKARRSAATASKPFTPPASGDIVNVQGIWVHKSIAAGLNSLLNAASAAGIDLGGAGYRDSSGQIALRRQNCGTSDFAIYQMDPFSCRPPTARPGSSNHERGLAVDFTVNGSVLTRSSKAFQWMSANAGKYGFYNLPSEPWHWSSDGK
jgi:LAS superfamily LD-carboxypeptidase LdcB